MGKITIKDIAKKANVSPGTVSKILTGKYKDDQIQISQATIDNVLKIVKEMEYRPNFAAQLLSTGKTYTIGIYFPKSKKRSFFFDHYYTDLLNSIGKIALENGYDILLISHGSCIDKFTTNRIDALIIMEQLEMDDEIVYLIEKKKPFVIINNLLDETLEVHSINVDNYHGVKLAADHFFSKNHKKIAFIGELISSPQKEHQSRLNFFKLILNERSISFNEELFLLGRVNGIKEIIASEHFNQNSGYFGMKHLIENYRGQFTAVFCANDIIAIGALNYLYKADIRVPDEISLIGFDDVDFAADLMGGLTTIRQPFQEMGRAAFTLLLDILNSKNTIQTENIKIKPDLMIRATVAQV